jgi:hypothetical protein
MEKPPNQEKRDDCFKKDVGRKRYKTRTNWLWRPGLPDGTKNPKLGTFLRALEGKLLVYFMVIRNILQPFGIFYDNLV